MIGVIATILYSLRLRRKRLQGLRLRVYKVDDEFERSMEAWVRDHSNWDHKENYCEG